MSAPAAAGGRRRVAPAPPPKVSTDGVSSSSQTSYDALKLKYMTVDRNYETLKQLTRKGRVLGTCLGGLRAVPALARHTAREIL